jgi:hypothetical protein
VCVFCEREAVEADFNLIYDKYKLLIRKSENDRLD